jgi:CRP-like cAMP-binding protein
MNTHASKQGSNNTNRLIDALAPETRARVLDAAEHVPLALRQVMIDIDRPIEYAYFPTHGVISMVSAILTGEAIETATVGREGMTGIALALGARQVSAQAFCQVAGFAYRIPADDFASLLADHAEFRLVIGRYTLAFLSQTAQSSACNRLHSIRQRCARWLLETHDRVSGETFGLTQEFLAQMLGVRRATVSQVQSALQRDGLIEYSYRQITVVDRPALEAAACECYRITGSEYARLVGGREIPSLFAEVVSAKTGETALESPARSVADDPPGAQ